MATSPKVANARAASAEPASRGGGGETAVRRAAGPKDQLLSDVDPACVSVALESHVRRLVKDAPPLTDQQRLRLSRLLGGSR